MKFQLKAVKSWLVTAAAVLLLPISGLGNSPFFAMDTGARGGPEVVVPMLKDLGYNGLGGSPAGAGAMASALEMEGMRLFNVYLTLNLQEGQPALTDALRGTIDELRGHGAALWISINKVEAKREDADAQVVAGLREIADYATPRGVAIALYPHFGSFLDHVEDAMRLANKLDRPEVGVTFNLCHWLRVEGERDPEPVLRAALPRLKFVTINGADAGETKKMDWARLIQPLDSGSYNVQAFLLMLRKVGYSGPIGLQAFGVPGDQRSNLRRSMAAWRGMQATASTLTAVDVLAIAKLTIIPRTSSLFEKYETHHMHKSIWRIADSSPPGVGGGSVPHLLSRDENGQVFSFHYAR